MIRRRVAKPTVSVELFPFLAVLMRAMGSLIVLLMISVRHARLAADKESAPDRSAEVAVELDRLAQQLDTVRAVAPASIDDPRDSLRAQVLAMRGELAALEARATPSSAAASDDRKLQQQLVDLKRRAAALETAVDQAHRENALSSPKSYAILPYDGKNGTSRRPIYIECLRNRMILQPEGIELSEADFAGVIGPSNVLIQTLRAASEYCLSPGHDRQEPYPLLIVRPEGIGAYYVARSALAFWPGEWGYELVDQNWKLEFHERDPALALAERTAVQQYRAAQVRYGVASARNGPGGGGGRGQSGRRFKVSQRGGLDPARGPGSGGDERDSLPDFSGLGDSGSEPPTESGAGEELALLSAPNRESAGNSAEKSLNSAPLTGRTAGSGLLEKTDTSENSSPDDSTNSDPTAGDPATVRDGREYAQGPKYRQNSNKTKSSRNSQPAPSMARDAPGDATATDQPGSPELRVGEYREPVKDLAKTRGKNWALRDASSKSLPISRPLRAQCTSDQFTLLPERQSPATSIEFGPRTEDCADELRSVLWGRMDTWGIAGRGMHWKPTLLVDVLPGGEARYAELEALLQGSGLALQRQQPPRGPRNPLRSGR